MQAGHEKGFIRLKIVSKHFERINTGITEIPGRKFQFQDFKLNTLKTVPGKYFASTCNFFGDVSSPLKTMVDGVDFSTMINESDKMIKKFSNYLQKIRFCVTEKDWQIVDELNQNATKIKKKFTNIISNITKDESVFGLRNNLLKIKTKCKYYRNFFEDAKCEIKECLVKYKKKAKFLKTLLQDGINYLGAQASLNKYLQKENVNIFMIFISEIFDYKIIFKNINYVYNILMSKFQNGAIFLIIDLDVITLENFFEIPDKPVIYHFKNLLLSKDVMQDMNQITNTGLIYFNAKDKNKIAPLKKSLLNIQCPGSFVKICSAKLIVWKCAKCKTRVEYGYDGTFYCDCGGCQIENCSYQCSDYRHKEHVGFKDLTHLQKMLDNLTPLEEVNILLIGQSGVGKSTWINAIANYLSYKSLDEAEMNEVIAVVPTKFTISDENFKIREIRVGKDENEAQIIGASGTQNCRSYAIVTKTQIIRFIDTPGILDTRGYEQDAENLLKIVQHIQDVDRIHGICYLALPNVSRLDACFKFCLKELFTLLRKKASKNIVFCFTNSRNTGYKPGETLPIITEIIKDVNSYIDISDATMYCFDNESFRFLCALKENINFPKEERASFAQSWERSVEETNRLISYVSSLKPYHVSDTEIITDLRYKISNVIDTLHDISLNSKSLEIRSLQDQKNDYFRKLLDLQSSVKVQETTLKKITVNGDIVCSNPTCTENFNNEIIYKTICCEECKIPTNKYDTLKNVDLLACEKLSNQICATCKCGWEQHMMIQYRLLKETNFKIDATVQEEIDKTKKLRNELQVKIEEVKKEMILEEEEKKVLIDFGTTIFKCLNKHSLLLYNDALGGYLDYLISSIETKSDKTQDDKTRIKNLNELKKKHEQGMKIANDVKKKNLVESSLNKIRNDEEFVEMVTRYQIKEIKFANRGRNSQKVIRLKNV